MTGGGPAVHEDYLERARKVAVVAKENAHAVDKDARFPVEAIDSARDQGLMSLLVSIDEGGAGLSFSEVAAITQVIAAACGSTGMIFAMHQNQMAGLVRHGDTEFFRERRRQIANDQLLLASATTEIGIGGDIRRSTCAVEPAEDGTFVLKKNAPVISYGEYADVILVTARRSPDAEPNDQVLVYCEADTATLQRTGDWDTLGFRGTCSPGFQLEAHGSVDAILPHSFADISARSMLPASHLFWSSVWLGISTEAVDRARAFVRRAARRTPGTTPPGAARVAELGIALQTFASTVNHSAQRFDAIEPGSDELESVPFALAMNGLKISSSNAVVDITGEAMLAIGIAGYRQDSPYSVGRLLRDAYGASIMVNNDRILGNSAVMELVNRRGGFW